MKDKVKLPESKLDIPMPKVKPPRVECEKCGGTGRRLIATEFMGCFIKNIYVICDVCNGKGRLRGK